MTGRALVDARWAALVRAIRTGEPACRVGVLSGAGPGTVAVLGHEPGNGGAPLAEGGLAGLPDWAAPLAPALAAAGRESLADGRPRVEAAGEATLFADPVLPLPRLIVLGGGHVARELVPVALGAGFAAAVVDDRPDFARADRFPGAETRCVDPVAAVEEMRPGPADFIVIATRSHESDLDALRGVLKWPVAYVGMIGSRRKVRSLREALLASGDATAELLDWVRMPVGLDLGAETPSEIAIAVVAELISVRRGGSGLPLSVAGRGAPVMRAGDGARGGGAAAAPGARPGGVPAGDAPGSVTRGVPAGDREAGRVWQALADAWEAGEPCALATVVRVRGSTPRGPGAHILVRRSGFVGSIGGGPREAEVVRTARECLESDRSLLLHLDFTEEQDALCGGAADVLIEPVKEGRPWPESQ